ncbi:hypothetical protein [Streptomyces albidochromogenes]|uniref:hypothetical protein n=1 Tax=Streptomyces albidochromogenes TaxID=329524 RepID=UPI003CD078A9
MSDLARLRRVRDRIDREYPRPLDVEALARGAEMPAGQLSRQFRLAYGKSPYAYVMARRTAGATTRWAGMPSCAAKPVTGPVRNGEAPAPEPQLA